MKYIMNQWMVGISLVPAPLHKGSGDIRRVMMFCSNIPATLLFCNYIGVISIPTQKDGNSTLMC